MGVSHRHTICNPCFTKQQILNLGNADHHESQNTGTLSSLGGRLGRDAGTCHGFLDRRGVHIVSLDMVTLRGQALPVSVHLFYRSRVDTIPWPYRGPLLPGRSILRFLCFHWS